MSRPRHFRLLLVFLGAALFSSCYYDPYSYGGGYGGTYGYAGGGATFVHTSSDRWLYDPAVYSYYDRHRGAYYDPWLGGYYPAGYCPRPIRGARHPYGWNGRGVCPVPRGVNNRRISNYQDRLALLRARNYQWADNVRHQNQANLETWRRQRVRAASNYRQNLQDNRRSQATPNRNARQQNNWLNRTRSTPQIRDRQATPPNFQQQAVRNPRQQAVQRNPRQQVRQPAVAQRQAAQAAQAQRQQRQAARNVRANANRRDAAVRSARSQDNEERRGRLRR